jgi:hypothetical protein
MIDSCINAAIYRPAKRSPGLVVLLIYPLLLLSGQTRRREDISIRVIRPCRDASIAVAQKNVAIPDCASSVSLLVCLTLPPQNVSLSELL